MMTNEDTKFLSESLQNILYNVRLTVSNVRFNKTVLVKHLMLNFFF